jgi:hypothetical protein
LAQAPLVIGLVVDPALNLRIVVFALQPEEGADAVTGIRCVRHLLGLVDRLQHPAILMGAADLGQLRNGAAGRGSVAGDEQVLGVGLDAFARQIQVPSHVQRADFHRFTFFLGVLLQRRHRLAIKNDLRLTLELDDRSQWFERRFTDRDEARAAEGRRAHRVAQHQVVVTRLLGERGPAFGGRSEGLAKGNDVVVPGIDRRRMAHRFARHLLAPALVLRIAIGKGLFVRLSQQRAAAQQQTGQEHGAGDGQRRVMAGAGGTGHGGTFRWLRTNAKRPGIGAWASRLPFRRSESRLVRLALNALGSWGGLDAFQRGHECSGEFF